MASKFLSLTGWKAASSPSDGGGILAYLEFTGTFYGPLTTAALTAVDGTNLLIPSFTAPASGVVVVTIGACMGKPAARSFLGVVTGTTTKVFQVMVGQVGDTANGWTQISRRVSVTPGATISGWKIAVSVPDGGSCSLRTQDGAGDNPLIATVWAA